MNKYEKGFKKIIDELDKIGMFHLKEERNDYLELVERATPKKVINRKETLNGICGNCPNCIGRPVELPAFSFKQDDFCPSCGQALDWSGE